MSGAHLDHGATDPFSKRGAVAIAIFTVVLAFSNMLTNQARTQAILSSNRATNQWSYYQSKSTKQAIVHLERDMLARLGKDEPATFESLDREDARYETEKETIRLEAEGLNTRLRAFEHEEHLYEYAATIAELAIVLAGVALLLTSRKTLYASMAVAAIAVAIVGYASVTGPEDEHPTESPAGKPAAAAAQPTR